MAKRVVTLLSTVALFAEINVAKSEEIGVDVNSLTTGTDKKPYWDCTKNSSHPSWRAEVKSRMRGRGCSNCIKPGAVLLSEVALFAEINLELSASNGVDVFSLTTGSTLKPFWNCSKVPAHNAWRSSVANRSQGKGCPECHCAPSTYICDTALYSELDDVLNDKAGIDTLKLTTGSNVKAHWKCIKNDAHSSWFAEIKGRYTGRGCPQCAGSVTETAFREMLNEYSGRNFVSSKIDACWNKRPTMQIDMLDESNKVVVEYDSNYAHGKNDYHNRTAEQGMEFDIRKTLAALEAGYTVIRIRELPLNDLALTNPKFHQIGYTANSKKDAVVNAIVDILQVN